MGHTPHVECLNVVRHCRLAYVSRQSVIAFVSGIEGPQHVQVTRIRCPLDEVPNRRQRWVLAVIASHGSDINIVQSRQVIEVENMRLYVVGPLNQVANYPTVVRYLIGNAEGTVEA